MSRTPLVVGAIVVLAAAVVLVIALRGGDDTSDKGTPSGTQPGGETASKPVAPQPSHNPSVTVTDIPRLPGGNGPTLPAAGENPREYAVGDMVVRDHRAGDNKPLDIPPNVHPAEGRKIPSTLTHSISQRVKATMGECLAQLPAEGRGAKPRVEGQVIITIKSNTVSVAKSTFQLRDVEGASVEPVKQCLEQKALGATIPAPDEADLESYSINLTYAIR